MSVLKELLPQQVPLEDQQQAQELALQVQAQHLQVQEQALAAQIQNQHIQNLTIVPTYQTQKHVMVSFLSSQFMKRKKKFFQN